MRAYQVAVNSCCFKMHAEAEGRWQWLAASAKPAGRSRGVGLQPEGAGRSDQRSQVCSNKLLPGRDLDVTKPKK